MGRRVPQVLGRIARSAGRIFGKDNQTRRQEGEAINAMCPVCVANIALIAAGTTSSGGLTALALSKLYKRKQTKQIRGNENETGGTRTKNKTDETTGNRIGK